MGKYQTDFGSIHKFKKGGVTVIDDDAKKYVFSNIFEVASKAKPYERMAVAKNFEYVIEAVRAEGTRPGTRPRMTNSSCRWTAKSRSIWSSWTTRIPPSIPRAKAPTLEGHPDGKKMGRLVLRQGHMALLPVGAAYRFQRRSACTLMIQTIDGPETVHKWAEICQH